MKKITWIHVSVLLFLSAFFWTNLFPAVGGLKTFSFEEFGNNFKAIWCCHFSDDCVSPAKLGFILVSFWFLLLVTSGLLLLKFQSNPVAVICNACLALPLLPVFYELIRPDLVGILFTLNVTSNGIIGIVAFVCGYICLSLYHKEQRLLTLTNYFNIFWNWHFQLQCNKTKY